jgi:Tfp pilus assembly protein PilO
VNEKKLTWTISACAGAAMLGISYLIWSEHESIDAARAATADLRTQIDTSRKLLAGTPQVEKDVIVLRETEQAIKEILPDDKDLYNLHRDLQSFCESSEVRITSIKRKDATANARKKETEAFEKVTYELTLEGDAFRILAFLDRVEGHTRFLRIPTINWTASAEKTMAETGRAAHKVKVEVETFVYKPQGGPQPVKIEGYARKRELLLGEIAKRREAVSVEHYAYRGARGRRDPWVDPRVPVEGQDPNQLPIQEQSRIVDGLVERVTEAKRLWDSFRKPDISIVEQMQLRADFDTKLTSLEENSRQVVADASVSFAPAENRLQREVLEPTAQLRRDYLSVTGPTGPSVENLKQILQTMQRHVDAGQPKLALEAFNTVENSLGGALADPQRKAIAQSLRRSADEARILVDFQQIDLRINGIAIQDGVPPVVLINGKALSEGDAVSNELVIHGIRPGEIEFVFRGVVLVRRF